MNKLSIIHYQPISYYPPAMNLVSTLEDKLNIELITTKPDKGPLTFKPKIAKFYTLNKANPTSHTLFHFLAYSWFVLFSLIRLIVRRPQFAMYYESVSAMPVYLYKKFFNNEVDVIIHYHEYVTEEEYNMPGMRLFKINHQKERRWLYQKAKWISHTNRNRLEFFARENMMVRKESLFTLPNYPPRSWLRKTKRPSTEKIKCIYIGSLSLEDTFVEKFCEWVACQGGQITFDIFSFNFKEDTLKMIEALASPHIVFHKEGISYNEIPVLLDNYDVGLLLYKAKELNMKYNETNKFYEYLICGLGVWYPKEMTLLHLLDKSLFNSNILEMDFDDLSKLNYKLMVKTLDNPSYNLFAEDVYNHFFETING